jgi:hypothetical protein
LCFRQALAHGGEAVHLRGFVGRDLGRRTFAFDLSSGLQREPLSASICIPIGNEATSNGVRKSTGSTIRTGIRAIGYIFVFRFEHGEVLDARRLRPHELLTDLAETRSVREACLGFALERRVDQVRHALDGAVDHLLIDAFDLDRRVVFLHVVHGVLLYLGVRCVGPEHFLCESDPFGSSLDGELRVIHRSLDGFKWRDVVDSSAVVDASTLIEPLDLPHVGIADVH